MSKPELLHLRAFMVVAELRSFRQAAKALNLSPSSVSQAVRTLEERLNVALLLRSTRSVAITQAGAQLRAQLGPVMRDLDGALDGVSQWSERVQGQLKLNVPRSAATLLMHPLLSGFLKAYPDVSLEITTQDGLVDIVHEGHDAGIRFPEVLPRDMVALPIGPQQRFAVVGSTQWAASQGLPSHPNDLLASPCVRLRFPSGVLYQWQFRRNDEAMAMAVTGPLTVDDQRVALQAALDGVGWAYVYESMAAPHLRSGSLLQALADWCPSEPGFQLYYPGRRQVSPALRALIDWVRHAGRS